MPSNTSEHEAVDRLRRPVHVDDSLVHAMYKVDVLGVCVCLPFCPMQVHVSYMQSVMRSLMRGSHAILEMPPGSHKIQLTFCVVMAWISHERKQRLFSFTSQNKEPLQVVWVCKSNEGINRAIHLFRKTCYRPSTTTLRGRSKTCINQSVNNLPSALRSSACSKLTFNQQSRTTPSNLNIQSGCRHYDKSAMKHAIQATTSNTSIPDIEDIDKISHSHKACPYYTAVDSASSCDVIMLTEQYISQPHLRRLYTDRISSAVMVADDISMIDRAFEHRGSHGIGSSQVDAVVSMIDGLMTDRPDMMTVKDVHAICRGLTVALAGLSKRMKAVGMSGGINGTKCFSAIGGSFLDLIWLLCGKNDALEIAKLPITDCKLYSHYIKAQIQALDSNTIPSLPIKKLRLINEAIAELSLHLWKDNEFVSTKSLVESLRPISRFLTLLLDLYNDTIGTICTQSRKYPAYKANYYYFQASMIDTANYKQKSAMFSLESLSCSYAMQSFAADAKLISFIGLSDTLSPIEYYSSALGLELTEKVAGNIQDHGKNTLCARIVKSAYGKPMNTLYAVRDDADTFDAIGNSLVDCLKVSPGGVIVFFPSNDYIRKAIDHWKVRRVSYNKSVIEQMSSLKTICMQDLDSDQADAYIDTYLQSYIRGAVMFKAYQTGSYTMPDAVRYVTSLVVCVGVPFDSKVVPIVNAKEDLMTKLQECRHESSRRSRDWFVLQAFRRLSIAAGHALADDYDYGAVVFIDDRLRNRSWRDLLPTWIDAQITVDDDIEQTAVSLKNFFQSRSTQESMAHRPEVRRAIELYYRLKLQPSIAYADSPSLEQKHIHIDNNTTIELNDDDLHQLSMLDKEMSNQYSIDTNLPSSDELARMYMEYLSLPVPRIDIDN